ncbi:MAG: M20/M25/M40 family metallo-hydrolase [Elusimicrobiota bacterium]
MINKKRLLDNFIRLVKIDSISLKEGKIVFELKKQFKKLGVEFREDHASKKALGGDSGNLIVKFLGEKGLPVVLLSAHMDTVVPGQNINPKIRNGKISSDGNTILAADDKAGIAAIMEALTVIMEQKIPHNPAIILFTIAEEIGTQGSSMIKKKDIPADFGYILDVNGSIGKLVNAAPYYEELEITVLGKAAHAGVDPENGVSAVAVTAKALAQLKMGRVDKETTFNIGLISGGRAVNIVPDEVILKGEVRSHNLEKLTKYVYYIREKFRKQSASAGAKFIFKTKRKAHGFYLKKNHMLIKRFKEACKATGIKPFIDRTGGISDANIIFRNLGIPCGVISAGFQKPHGLDEFILVKDLEKAAELTFELLRVKK